MTRQSDKPTNTNIDRFARSAASRAGRNGHAGLVAGLLIAVFAFQMNNEPSRTGVAPLSRDPKLQDATLTIMLLAFAYLEEDGLLLCITLVIILLLLLIAVGAVWG